MTEAKNHCKEVECEDALGSDGTKQEQGLTDRDRRKESILLFPGCPGRQSIGKGLFLKVAGVMGEMSH